MTYILHYHDDTDDKPQTIDEVTAGAILWGYYGASVPEYWEKVEAGEKVPVPAGYISKAEEGA